MFSTPSAITLKPNISDRDTTALIMASPPGSSGSPLGLTPINFNANPVKTVPTAMLGAYYDVAKNQRLGVQACIVKKHIRRYQQPL